MIAPALLVGLPEHFAGRQRRGREPSVLNALQQPVASRMASAGLIMLSPHGFMLLFRAVFNFFVTSGSGGRR